MTVNGRTRLLYLLKLLYEQTDDEHTVTTSDIEEYFSGLNTVVDRKTIKQDIELLQEVGFDIIAEREAQNCYAIGRRLFELPELKLLIDAVESSKFITAKKSVELTEKLITLTSKHRAEDLKRHLYIADRVKPGNEKIYYTVDAIHTAINQGRQISFRYYEYNAERKRVFRNDGKRYRFSPYGLMWNEDHYYAVGYSEKHDKIITFRADRIVEIEILEKSVVPVPEDFSLPEFARKVFDMYDGKMERVTLRCKNDMMKVIIDRFGENVESTPLDVAHFKAEAEVSVSQTFFAWVFQFCGDIEIIAPRQVLTQYQEMLEKARK